MWDINQTCSFVVNVLCHVLILATFLTFFFFQVIAKLTTSHVNDELQSLVSDGTKKFMADMDQKDKDKNIDWIFLSLLSSNLKIRYNSSLQSVIENNQQLYDDTVCFLICFAVGLFLLIVYMVFKKLQLRLGFLALENLVIFFFVGMIEIYFFQEIASKYVPILPNDAMIAIVNRLKTLLQN